MSVVLRFGGTTSSYELEGVQEWNESLEQRVLPAVIPRRDGAVIDSVPAANTRIIDVQGILVGTAGTACRTKLDTLTDLVYNGRQQLYLNDDRYIYSVCQDFNYEYVVGFAAKAIKWSASFLCDDPYWYSTGTQSATQSTITSGTEATVACNLATTATHGNADTPPWISFDVDSGTATKVRFYNTNTNINRWCEVSCNMLTGISLVVNSADKTVKYNTGNVLPYFSGSFFNLAAGSTNNIIVLSTGAAADCFVYWRPRWY